MAVPVFLTVQVGDYVIVSETCDLHSDGWWMGQVLFVQGGARKSEHQTLFQVANIDTGVIHWINADLVINKFSA